MDAASLVISDTVCHSRHAASEEWTMKEEVVAYCKVLFVVCQEVQRKEEVRGDVVG